jgi:hypothetical protein
LGCVLGFVANAMLCGVWGVLQTFPGLAHPTWGDGLASFCLGAAVGTLVLVGLLVLLALAWVFLKRVRSR